MGNLDPLNHSRCRHNDTKEEGEERRGWLRGIRKRDSNDRGIQCEFANVTRFAIFKFMLSEAS